MISNRLLLNPLAVFLVLAEMAAILVLLSIEGQLITHINGFKNASGIVRMFDIGEEQNIPTLFSSLLLMLAAIFLAVISIMERNQKGYYDKYWSILSFGFLLMAVDEQFCFHERFTEPMQKLLGGHHLGFLYFAWVIPAIALLVVLAVLFLKFWWRLPSKTRFIFLIAAITYIGGCIGFELIGGRYAEMNGSGNWTYVAFETIEESLEMAGVIIFIWGLLRYMADNYKEIRIVFDTTHKEI
jgi:hypothetical protein